MNKLFCHPNQSSPYYYPHQPVILNTKQIIPLNYHPINQYPSGPMPSASLMAGHPPPRNHPSSNYYPNSKTSSSNVILIPQFQRGPNYSPVTQYSSPSNSMVSFPSSSSSAYGSNSSLPNTTSNSNNDLMLDLFLDSKDIYICAAYNPRCFVIQKVRKILPFSLSLSLSFYHQEHNDDLLREDSSLLVIVLNDVKMIFLFTLELNIFLSSSDQTVFWILRMSDGQVLCINGQSGTSLVKNGGRSKY